MKIKVLISLIILLIASCTSKESENIAVFSNDTYNDSIAIAESFSKAITLKDSTEHFLQIAQNTYQSNSETYNIVELYQFELSKFYIQSGKFDSARWASQFFLEKYGNIDTLKNAKFYNYIAYSYAYQSDYQNAIVNFKKALEIFEKFNDKIKAAHTRNNIGNIYFSLIDFESANKYFSEAYEDLKTTDSNDVYFPSITALYALTQAKLNETSYAQVLVNEALRMAASRNNINALIIAKYAQAEIQVALNNFEYAIELFDKSLNLSLENNQYQFVLLNYTTLLFCNMNLKNYNIAIENGQKAEELAHILNNENIKYSIYKNLAYSYEGIGNFQKSFEYLKKAHNIFSENSSKENKTIINDILLKYESEKKDRELAENQLIISEKNTRITKYGAYIVILISLVFSSIIGFLSYQNYQKSKLKSLAEKQKSNVLSALVEGEEKERKRLAQDLHDSLASDLVALKLKLENQNQNAQFNSHIEEIKKIHQEVRRISHNLTPFRVEKNGLIDALQDFCKNFDSQLLSVNFKTNINVVLKRNKDVVVYRVCQELIQNAIKHANAGNIDVQIYLTKNKMNITIEDNGKGIDENTLNVSDSISSIKNRIANIGGNIHIDTQPGKGTLFHIEINLE